MKLISSKRTTNGNEVTINLDLMTCFIDEGERRTVVWFVGDDSIALDVDYEEFKNIVLEVTKEG